MALVDGGGRPRAPGNDPRARRRTVGGFELLTEGPASRLALFRGCCGFAIAGSLLAVLTALMPHDGVEGFRASAIIAVAVASGLISLGFLLLGRRFPSEVLERLAVTGSFVYVGVFGLIVYLSGPGGAPTAATGLLAGGLGIFLLFSRRTAFALLAYLAVTYGVVLAALNGTAPLGRWTVTVGLASLGGAVARDLIDRIQTMARAEQAARAEAEEAQAELETANRHKSEFLAHMSHELRTPLNAIIGFSDVLAERLFGELNEKQTEYVDDVRTSGQHLLTLINDVLDVAKVETGRMDLNLDHVELAEVLSAGVGLFREEAARHRIDLDLRLAPDLGIVEADGRKVTQVVYNLVSNAVKFTPAGGRVLVTGRRRTHAVEVAVTDTGPGIAPEDHERVFEDFQQGSAPGRARQPGTGLGLPLARRFVELHGGRMSVQSRPGEGATVSFSLPLAGESKDGGMRAGRAVEAPPSEARPSMLEILATAGHDDLLRVVSGSGGALIAGGSLLGLLAVVLGRGSVPGLRVLPAGAGALLSLMVAAVVVVVARRLTPSFLSASVPFLCAGATVLASVEAYFAGPLGEATAAQMYVCIGGGCFLGLSRRMAVGQLALIGIGYASVLAAQTGVAAAPTQWMVVLGTTGALGALNAWISGRVHATAQGEQAARAEAERARAELEAASRHKSEFLASMSHELRTPLNAIIGFSEVLAEELFGELNVKQAEYVDDVRTSGQHLLALINDVLDLAKVEAGRMDLDLGPVDLAGVLEATVARLWDEASRRKVALTLELDPALGLVEADGPKLAQVIDHLVSNALTFTPDGGTVAVSGRRRTDDVEIAVRDTGPGIAPADRERIFGDFHRASILGQRPELGPGLGLALARGFVELHGGRVGVQSRPGEGATVSFSLPLVPASRSVLA